MNLLDNADNVSKVWGMSNTVTQVTRVLPDGTTTCCGAYTTYSIAFGDSVECCKGCWEEVIEWLVVERSASTIVELR